MNRAFAVILCLCLLVPAVRAAADTHLIPQVFQIQNTRKHLPAAPFGA